jgi:predicted Zn finger-like uncharacterized protein
MPISVECPSCRSTFRVKEESAGKRGRCPSCKAMVTVPVASPIGPQARLDEAALPRAQAPANDDGGYALAGGPKKARSVRVRDAALPGAGACAEGVREAAAPTQKTRTALEILAAFRGEIAPVRPSFVYSLCLLLVVAFMILLPLVYVALIGLTAFGLWYHVVNDAAMVQHAQGRGAKWVALLVYVLPLICGVVAVAFMLKPLFARPPKAAKGRALDPGAEPLLFAFVDGICKSVGAPRPGRIEVDCNVNAAAGYQGGWLWLFARKPSLVIGLGLVAGLSLKQFAGVMAHELGHLSQGSGAWLTEVVWSINAWFARLVYERDEWDDTLRDWSHGDHGYLMIIGWCGRLAVWLSRRVLWMLLHAGHLVNMVFLRQREYDADRYEARMVGAETFAQTFSRVRELGLASSDALEDLYMSWQERRLPDNFPKLILAKLPQIPRMILDIHSMVAGHAKAGLFDTHPSDKNRIARARAEAPGNGIFQLEGPATDVFRNFDARARTVTFDFYKSILGREIQKSQLFPVAEHVETQQVVQEGYVTYERFFLKALPLSERLALPLEYPTAPADPKGAKRALIEARNQQEATREACLAAIERRSEVDARLLKAEVAWIMLKCDVPVNAESWDLPAATVRAAEKARDIAGDEFRELTGEIASCTEAAARRLTLALSLLELDAVAGRIDEGLKRREEARALYPCTAHLASNVVSLLIPTLRIRTIFGHLIKWSADRGAVEGDPFLNAVGRAAGILREHLEALRWKVGDSIDYPFEHAQEGITLGRFAFGASLPDQSDIGGLLSVAEESQNCLHGLYSRALGRLTVTAEEVERSLGLAPIRFEESD